MIFDSDVIIAGVCAGVGMGGKLFLLRANFCDIIFLGLCWVTG